MRKLRLDGAGKQSKEDQRSQSNLSSQKLKRQTGGKASLSLAVNEDGGKKIKCEKSPHLSFGPHRFFQGFGERRKRVTPLSLLHVSKHGSLSNY